MTFDWKEYLRLAEELLNRPEESCLRSAISRSYYGVFCIARAQKNFTNYGKGDVHQKVINTYRNSQNENEKSIGEILDTLRRLRNDADYDEHKVINRKLAERSVARANEILTRMGRT